MLKSWRIRRTTVITVGLLAFLVGLGIARTDIQLPGSLVLICLLFFAATLKRPRLITVLAVGLLGLSLGWWRGSQFLASLTPYHEIDKQTVLMEVTAITDGVYGDKAQLSFDGSRVRILEPFEATLPGKIKVQGFGEPAVYRGDVVRAEGRFFPTRGSRQGTVSFAELKLQDRSNFWLDNLRLRFIAGMETALPEPLASFALGLLIGQRTTLPDEVNKQLSTIGLTHIIAVSGYNLTIIVRAIQRFGKRRSRYQVMAISITLITGFLLVTGFSASIVRAAIVSVLSLLAWYYGRIFRPLLLLAIAAVLTAGWNPLYIWSDIGWYLSFLAFYGVIVLAPMVIKRLYGDRKTPRPLTMVLYETLAAQLMTTPLILYIFGVTSTVSVLSNLIIVPMVPLAMLLSFGAGLSGMIFSVFAGWLAWPAKLILTYMLDVVNLLSKIPHAAVEASLPLVFMICLYGSVALVSLILWRKTDTKYDKITDIDNNL